MLSSELTDMRLVCMSSKQVIIASALEYAFNPIGYHDALIRRFTHMAVIEGGPRSCTVLLTEKHPDTVDLPDGGYFPESIAADLTQMRVRSARYLTPVQGHVKGWEIRYGKVRGNNAAAIYPAWVPE